MARKSGSTIVQEELYPPSAEFERSESSRSQSARSEHARAEYAHGDLDDARLVDLDADEQSPFLRAQ
jgi:hypothetical protein